MNKQFMLLITGMCACFGISAMQRHLPANIYDAIKKDDQVAIDRFIAEGQAHMGEVVLMQTGESGACSEAEEEDWSSRELFGVDVDQTCFCTPFVCSFPPTCCVTGSTVSTPLYVALERINIPAARKLVMNAGARLYTGQWREKPRCVCCWCWHSSPLRTFRSSAELLAMHALRRADARELLHDAIVQGKQLLSGRQTDNEVCDSLIKLNDPALLQAVIDHHLVHPGSLLVVAAERRRQLVLDRQQLNLDDVPGWQREPLWSRLWQSLITSGDYRIADIILQVRPSQFEGVFTSAMRYGHAELVTHLLARGPRREWIISYLSQIRNPLLARQLSDYIAAPAAATALLPVAVLVAPAPQASAVRIVADDCPVCSYPLNTRSFIRTLPCGHNFHGECVSTWLAEHHTCPVCRASVP